MQAEDERLPMFKKKFDLGKEVASKLRRLEPDASASVNEQIRNREQELKIP